MVITPVRLSVVIPATDRPATLTRCLAAIGHADDGPEEVVVVDSPADLGVCAARNLGVERASGDVIVFVDSDVEVHPDVFRRLRAAFADDPRLVALHGSYDDAPAHRDTVSTFRNLLHHDVHTRNAGPVDTFWTGLGAVRRDALVAAGGFDDERFSHPSVEDIDLGLRLAASGARLRLDPDVRGTHLKRWTLPTMVRTDFARRAVPWLRLQLERGRLSSSLNMGWKHRISAVACLVAVLAAVVARVDVVAGSAALLLVANARFYGLLLWRLGPLRAPAAVLLHVLHHLVAIAAVPVAVVAHVLAARPARGRVRRAAPVPGAEPA